MLKLFNGLDETVEAEENYAWEGIYFHGQAERWVEAQPDVYAPDLVSGPSYPSEGIHDAEAYGLPCNVYLWWDGGIRRGLVVAKEDKQGNEYALDRFVRQRGTL